MDEPPSSGTRGAIEIAVLVEAADWTAALPGAETLAERAARAVLAAQDETGEDLELAVLLTDDATVQDLNARYRGKDRPTNVLSFASDDPAPPGEARLLGDLALAFGTCRREAAEQGKPLEDHLTHLVVHGTLHLLGYDHEDEDEAEAMEARERRLLADLGVADPYAERAEAAGGAAPR